MTHTCAICHRDKLNLVEGVLEEHAPPQPPSAQSYIRPCEGSGTDRYVRGEEQEPLPLPPVPYEEHVKKLSSERTAHDAASVPVIQALSAALYRKQARSRALREAAMELVSAARFLLKTQPDAAGNFELSNGIGSIVKAVAALDTAAPIPPDSAGTRVKLMEAQEGWRKEEELRLEAEDALRNIAILCTGNDPSDGEGTQPSEITEWLEKRLADAAGDGELLDAMIEKEWCVVKLDDSPTEVCYEVYDPIACLPKAKAATGRDAIRAAIRAEKGRK